MATARGYKSRLMVDFEDTFGSTPGAPDGRILPFNKNGLRATRNLGDVETIRDNRGAQQPFRRTRRSS